MTILLALVLATAAPTVAASDEGEQTTVAIPTASPEFVDSRDEALRRLTDGQFERRLQSPGFGAMSSDAFNERVTLINRRTPVEGVGPGVAGVKYDVILQPGHYGRTTGVTGASGKLVSERELVAFVTAETARRLRAMKYNVLVVNADDGLRDDPKTDAYDGLTARVFLAVHADGSVAPCKAGPSLGYAPGTSPFAMHAVGWAVSKALGYRYKEFKPDGYTANAANYYMFRRVRADELAGILEIGEVTCEDTEKKLIDSSIRLGANVANAVDFVLRQ